jgi:hypothetical protein
VSRYHHVKREEVALKCQKLRVCNKKYMPHAPYYVSPWPETRRNHPLLSTGRRGADVGRPDFVPCAARSPADTTSYEALDNTGGT